MELLIFYGCKRVYHAMATTFRTRNYIIIITTPTIIFQDIAIKIHRQRIKQQTITHSENWSIGKSIKIGGLLIFYGCKRVCHAVATAFRTRNYFIIIANPTFSFQNLAIKTHPQTIKLTKINRKNESNYEAYRVCGDLLGFIEEEEW